MEIKKLCRRTNMQLFSWPMGEVVISAIVPTESDLKRIETLLEDAVEEGAFEEYFTANWFPLVKAKDLPTAITRLELKAKNINSHDVNLSKAAILSHWQCIEDNFKWYIPVTMEDALVQHLRLCSNTRKKEH